MDAEIPDQIIIDNQEDEDDKIIVFCFYCVGFWILLSPLIYGIFNVLFM